MRSPFPLSTNRRQLALVAGLAALLAVLAVLQWRWIGRWGTVEEARLQSLLRVGAAQVDRGLTDRLVGIADAFAQMPVGDAAAGDALAARLAAWHATADAPDLVANVFWVRPGPDPALSVLDGATLRPMAWPAALADWRRALAAFPARLVPPPGSSVATVRLDDGALPAAPAAVLVPVLPPGGADLRFALVVLDGEVLADRVLPELLAGSLVGAELFDVRLVSARDPSVTLYDQAPEADVFEAPDLDVGVGPGETQELAVALPPGSRVETTREQVVEETATEDSRAPTHRWRLVARHRQGSIAVAAGTLRRRQLGVAFGVLAVLAAAVALLVASARRERALAGRQLAFVAGVSHELRTPLSVLRTAGENLADGVVGDDGVRRYGALVRDESQRLAEMVETVLTYAGADAATPRRVRVDVADVVADALAQARPIVEEAGAEVTLALHPALPPLDADPVALATALRNLLANAARHGGPNIRVASARAALDGARAVALSVADDGPGFDAAEAVFEPFVRARRAVEAQTPGSGLGLALVRRVAETHGGTVEADSKNGAVVTLTLPTS